MTLISLYFIQASLSLVVVVVWCCGWALSCSFSKTNGGGGKGVAHFCSKYGVAWRDHDVVSLDGGEKATHARTSVVTALPRAAPLLIQNSAISSVFAICVI